MWRSARWRPDRAGLRGGYSRQIPRRMASFGGLGGGGAFAAIDFAIAARTASHKGEERRAAA